MKYWLGWSALRRLTSLWDFWRAGGRVCILVVEVDGDGRLSSWGVRSTNGRDCQEPMMEKGEEKGKMGVK